MPITQGQGSSRGAWSPAMARTLEGPPRQALNHTARQISGQHDQEIMARERQMMFLQNSLHAYPGWRPSVQAPPLESSDHFTESLNPFGDHRSFLHPAMYFEASGPGRDDQLLAAMGQTPHHQASQHLPTPESFPRQVEIHDFAKVGWLTVSNSEGSHVGDGHFYCAWEWCTYSVCFRDKLSVWHHIKESHMSSGRIECNWDHCSYSDGFSSKNTLWRHIQSKHLDPNGFQCPLCNKFVSRKDKLLEHRRAAHG
ncbi:unnamed protein product [Penicillium pancosmium]